VILPRFHSLRNSFYTDEDDSGWIRFTVSQDGATIEEAISRLEDDRWW
jgi:hypothetical protein